MKNIKKSVILLLVVSFLVSICPVFAEGSVEYFVSPYGRKNASGTIDDPFDTLYTAIETIETDGSAIVINMLEGIYYMPKPVVFSHEFSGTLGASITVKAYNDEKVVLSGGRPVVGWKETDDGLWRAYAPEYKYVRNLEMNSIGAKRAHTEAKIFHQGTFGDGTYPDGIYISKSDVPEDFTGKNCELLFQSNWNEIHIKIDKCVEDSSDTGLLKLYFKKPYNAMAFSTRPSSVRENVYFTIINDKALLDNEGEFYFDNKTGFLYYKPRPGEIIEGSVGYIAEEEVLLKIQGENTVNKAGNLVFEGLNFANTTWKKGEYEGFVSRQSVSYYDMTNDLKNASPAYQTIPAAVQLDYVDNVVFRNNTFSNLGAVALGFYDGVTNCRVEGNIFHDIGSSAISVGLEAHRHSAKEGSTNVAFRKKAWASDTYTYYNALQALNGGLWTAPSGTYATFTVDLEKEYTISGIELVPRGDANYDKPSARMNFEILASSDKDFSEYSVLGRQGAEDFGIDNTWSCDVSDETKYRYIRFRKTDSASSEISDFRVYTGDLDGIAEKEVCTDNVITNNVIARSGNDYIGSAGIHAFYTNGLEISNNLLTDLPYTGISLGWGWQRDNNTCGNNIIRKNRIEHIMQRQYDGGGIYILGDQPDLLIEENVIRDIRYGAGGIYPDEGTSGTSEEPISIRSNVVEDAAYWLHMWSASSKYITTENNYTTIPSYLNSGSSCSLSGNVLYIKNNVPSSVQALIDSSGPTGEYALLSDRVEGLVQYEPEDVSEYLNYGPHTFKTLDTATYVKQYMTGLLMSANWYKELIECMDSVGEYPEYTAFLAALEEAKAQYDFHIAGEGSVQTLSGARVDLKNSIDALVKTDIFSGFEEVTEFITASLITRLAP